MAQFIIHVDMDAFFASVEIRDNPELRSKPLIIGALPSERGVVATCSYEARKYGVHSAMNIKDAFRRCPGGTYMHPNIDKYKAVSLQLNEIWNTYATVSQRISLDEAYLDVGEQAGDCSMPCKSVTASTSPDTSRTSTRWTPSTRRWNICANISAPE